MSIFLIWSPHPGAAGAAGAILLVAEEAIEDRRELADDVLELEALLVELLPALPAIPHETVQLARPAPALYHQPHRVRGPLGRVRDFGRQQKDFAFPDRQVDRFSVVADLEHHVALDLVEELLAGIDVIVGARVRAADHHADELRVLVDLLVADLRF